MRNSWRKLLYHTGGKSLTAKDGETWSVKEDILATISETKGKI